ncbi:hypothetical protein N7474_009932 [Penicillium riverlandense]|uniref:uncharacterized protein n=1 Tax=Penicillium riverlandense TaxID=1903569 RepID=UPI0025471155|nr:uncharacterized protein N7474_009932 [Penicillium riverlandense]KAJ5808663.1 hypothetical protein N7474_009932 [Penicillium riverlandense]
MEEDVYVPDGAEKAPRALMAPKVTMLARPSIVSPPIILFAVDANTFASLALLNQQWRQVSESASLYAYHLLRCPAFSSTTAHVTDPVDADNLIDVKHQFLTEVRRNAFDVFLRPRKTLVKLISSSMSSATAFPQGEVFRFSFSGNGQLVLCISSSRIVVLDVGSDPVAVKHELKTRRRALGATVRDDGSMVAVLSSMHQVNIYQLSDEEAKHIQSITLNDAPRDLTFSPTGSVLALAFEDNIEVYAVGSEVLSTERRAARCLRVDSITFSSDGSMLLGSPSDGEREGIITITAPFYTEPGVEASPEEVHMRMWTTQILFPETTDGFSHACIISAHEEGDDSWILGYDNQLATFRAIRMNDIDAGTVYFASPFWDDETREQHPSMLPTTDVEGELVVLGFQDSGLWLYGIPGRLNVAPKSASYNGIRGSQLCGDHHLGPHASVPRDNVAQLQKIIRQPKVLVRGRQVTDMHGITSACWVRSSSSTPNSSRSNRRLVAVAPGGVLPQNFGEEDIPVDGGRVLLLDFERSTRNGETVELDIEVGETAPKILVEPSSSMDAEVELERRRTRIYRPGSHPVLSTPGQRPLRPPISRENRRTASQSAVAQIRPNTMAFPNPQNVVDNAGIPDIPYDNTQPRSQDSLRRAATAAASTRGRYDPRYRSTPRHRYLPHESDADNWVPPPPPYSRKADNPLPEDLRQTLLPGAPAAAAAAAGPSGDDGPANNNEPPNDEPATHDLPQPVSRTRSTRQRQRPQSIAILQRLGTITGSRLGGRNKRNSTVIAVDQLPEPVQAPSMEPSESASQVGRRPQQPVVALNGVPQSQLFSSSNQPVDEVRPPTANAQPPGSQLPVNTLGEAYYHAYAASSPNLVQTPQHAGRVQATPYGSNFQASRQQVSTRRRVLTEPGRSAPPQSEEWRRRIEDWNEHTIKERNRLNRRTKMCIVM